MLELPSRWRGVAKLAYAFRERYEPELVILDRLVGPGQVAVDVGASYGIYTCILARLVGPAGRVYAFEPAAEAAAVLRRNVERNGLGWVEVHQLACGHASGSGVLHHEPDPSRNWLAASGEGEEVAVVRLDDVVERADFIKIDVEGAEELVLLGAARVVESRPRILFEVNREASVRLGLAPEGAWELLRQLGYRFFRVVGRDLKPLGTPPHGGNVVALPGAPGGCE
jgi:FkbM family methyltransferase